MRKVRRADRDFSMRACLRDNQAARDGVSALYERVSRLLDELAVARLDGRLLKGTPWNVSRLDGSVYNEALCGGPGPNGGYQRRGGNDRQGRGSGLSAREAIAARHWRRMAEECGINGTALLHRVSELANMFAAKADEAAARGLIMLAGDHRVLEECANAIKASCETVLTNLVENGAGPAAKTEHLPLPLTSRSLHQRRNRANGCTQSSDWPGPA